MIREDFSSALSRSMRDCLDVSACDRIAVFYGNSKGVFEYIREAASMLSAMVEGVDIDSYERPLTRLPSRFKSIASRSFDVSFYVAGVLPGELPSVVSW